MIIITDKKYRPGDDDVIDNNIVPIFNYGRNSYIPSRTEILSEDDENERI